MSQLFYSNKIENGLALLDEEESRHLTVALRKKVGDNISLTDGLGFFYSATIAEIGKRHALARIVSQEAVAAPKPRLHLAIAPTKQMERLEWFLEKATEIGVDEITPIHCKRSERDNIRLDRLEKIILSAMKQSLRAWLPVLHPLTPFKQLIATANTPQKHLAWCSDAPTPLFQNLLLPGQDLLLAIGPEGDFSPDEVDIALKAGFQAVSLGQARLRTETAGVVVTSVFRNLTTNEAK